MQAYRVEATITKGKTLVIKGLPFQAGDKVEVIVLECVPQQSAKEKRYPLRGKPIRYENPTEPVALKDWEALG